MKFEKRVVKVLNTLDEYYPRNIPCYLNHETPWQLLIATILSAQCTDDRVNKVTKDLFEKYRSVEAFAQADIKELEEDIRSTGFYRNKAKNIIACCKKLQTQYDSQVPKDMDQLTDLDGVGRKTANVIRGNIFKEPSIVVDTHVKRVSNRLGFVKSDDPVKIEFELMDVLPKEHWIDYNTQIIAHGREICKARGPLCEKCFFLQYCPYGLQYQYQQIVDSIRK
ncbi:DNA-(apurinic or apyrimidinic site) lyase /endonuclease III [Natranaerovirga hydrolytica]|uniref:Endonuclease III n=1 Tax=Natranaerovirga hydrolytica TaxID=680378 RepID=A0A4V2PZ97_9FIRM|nr:endonuclease III [Natranaerovirga hydrolytica]TCK89021.1 DNA-(apurinic or apyrimidinic site) lyase /endonuclease III [Natranaerovirga hydrolytica]